MRKTALDKLLRPTKFRHVDDKLEVVAKNLDRISGKLHSLEKKELGLIKACLEDCFEQGQICDSIPILVDRVDKTTGTIRRKQARKTKRKKVSET